MCPCCNLDHVELNPKEKEATAGPFPLSFMIPLANKHIN